MTTTAEPTRAARDDRAALPVPSRWHRPLLALAAVMAVLAIATLVGSLVDDRTVTGVNLWLKPLKFALSIGIYAVSLAWLIGLAGRGRAAKVLGIAGTVSVVGLIIEAVVIVGAAAAGVTSHFNVSTPFHSGLWSAMAVSIVVVWMMALLTSIVLFRVDLGDRARTTAIRAGAVLAVVGMGLAFLMTSPTAQQLADYQGIVGAHAVGVADGGAGLPLLGWSTVAGDLRVPHFVGMHALQLFPLLVLGLEVASRRVPVLRRPAVRHRLVVTAVVGFAATLVVLTWQALSGQSIVRPEGAILVAGLGVAALTAIGAVVAVRRKD